MTVVKDASIMACLNVPLTLIIYAGSVILRSTACNKCAFCGTFVLIMADIRLTSTAPARLAVVLVLRKMFVHGKGEDVSAEEEFWPRSQSTCNLDIRQLLT